MKAKCFHEGLAQGLAPGLFPSPTFLSILTSHFIPNLHILQRTSTNRYSTVYQTSSFHVPQSLPTVKQSCGIYSWCLFFDADAGRMPNLSVYWAPLLFELLLPKFRKVAMNKNWYGDSNFFIFDLLNLLNIFLSGLLRSINIKSSEPEIFNRKQQAWHFLWLAFVGSKMERRRYAPAIAMTSISSSCCIWDFSVWAISKMYAIQT